MVQQHAIHYPTVGFVCQRQRTTGKSSASACGVLIDCNTSQIPAVKALLQNRNAAAADNSDDPTTRQRQQNMMEATKQILLHDLEANLREHLLQFRCSSSDKANKSTATSSTSKSQYKLQYDAQVCFTTPAYAFRRHKQQQQGRFILFLNHRLVDLPALKRAMEMFISTLLSEERLERTVILWEIWQNPCSWSI